jgi:DNA-binding HxlR family transcriptional regulator
VNDKANLILHPVRMRIIQAMIGKRRNVQQLQQWLPDIPQATLYRQLQKLVQAGILLIVDRKQVRGAVEKTYALAEHGSELTEADLTALDSNEHIRLFITFLAKLLGDFGQYVQQEEFDMKRDGAGYRQAALYLSESEWKDMAVEVSAAIRKHMDNEPSPGRRRYGFATILIPEGRKEP